MKTNSTAALAALALFVSIGAQAAAQRTFVASGGSDANTCSISLPCRSFTSALAQTSAGGEIIVLDSAGYGPVSIAQSVSIVAPDGVYAGVSVVSGTGVTVAGTGLRVVLRGLSINGLGGSIGINVSAPNSEVHIEHPVVSNFTGAGIAIDGAGARVYVEDAQLRSNTQGIAVTGGAKAYVDRARIEENSNNGALIIDDGELYLRNGVVHRNGTGLAAIVFATGTIRLVVESTLISGSGFGGINVQVQGVQTNRVDAVVARSTIVDNGGPGFSGINFQCIGSTVGALTLVDTTISHHLAGSATGLQAAGPGCVASVGGSTFTRNVTGMTGSAPTLKSFGNNQFDQNGTDIFGAFTTKGTQ